MSKGRPKKSDAQKKLEGTYRHDRKSDAISFDLLAVGSEVPHNLLPGAAPWWDYFLKLYDGKGILQTADIPNIIIMCNDLFRYERAMKTLAKSETYMDSNGNHKIKPGVRIVKSCQESLSRLMAKYGLSPSDREKIMAGDKEDIKDPLAGLL